MKHSSVPAKIYNPEDGLKTLAIAEAAEKHFRRAKDATRLLDAVELKLAEQRKFVLWWDSHGNPRGGPKANLVESAKFVDKDTLHRWRTKLKDEKTYASTLEKAQTRCLKVCESWTNEYAKAIYSGEFEWYTPAEFVEAARDVLGAIDLDPASSDPAQETVKSDRYFTREQDGLTQSWFGRVWLNPPYTQPDIALFVHKLVEEFTLGHTTAAILLTHNYTDTAWFHLAVSACSAICFTRGRIAFIDTRGEPAAPTQGQAFFYFGAAVPVFAQRFADIGFLVRPL